MKKKQGISLIVLVITIIVIVILAVAIILSIASNNPIDNANKAVKENNKATLKEAANLAYLDWYSEDIMGNTTKTAEEYVKESLGNQGFSTTEIDKITITENGVEITDTTNTITFTKNGDLLIGSKVTASNGEEFYVIGGDTVGTEILTSTQDIILLSKYNLKKENDEITLKQDTSGDLNECAFSSTNYWSSVEGITYPADLNDEEKYPIGSATSIITTAKEYGESLGVAGRLLTSDEAAVLKTGYAKILFGKNTLKGYLNFWLSTKTGEYGNFYVNGNYNLVQADASHNEYYGVRPVITVSKSLIK